MFQSSQLAPVSGFVGIGAVVDNRYDAHFSRLNSRRVQVLGNTGYVAVPIYSIQRPPGYLFSSEELQRANLLDTTWIPKGSSVPQEQRCWDLWADNFCFHWTRTMPEPHLVLGRWTKQAKVWGKMQNNDDLVVAAGGHVERPGTRVQQGYGQQPKYEAGDLSIRAAADKEIKEEIGLNKADIKQTVYLGVFEDALRDPRRAGISHVFLRWIETEPKTSAELKNVVTVPVSHLPALCARQTCWNSPDGKQITLGLNHHILIQTVMQIQETLDFLMLIRTFYDSAPPQQQAWGPASATLPSGTVGSHNYL
jgi:ADP-ribose pyrophosphatase YjhB (NUDIX family)